MSRIIEWGAALVALATTTAAQQPSQVERERERTAALAAAAAHQGPESEPRKGEPFPSQDFWDALDWLTLRGHQRSRYETLDGQFRAGRRGSDQIFAFRTSLELRMRLKPVELLVEGLDSRQEKADEGTPINTTIVNAVELLQGYAALEYDDVMDTGDRFRVQVGRQTLDIGSRRLMARNRYRNTINSFTGVNALWRGTEGETVRAFWFLPVERQPTDRASLLDNDIMFDEEHIEQQFFGLVVNAPDFVERTTAEFSFYGLLERDADDFATRNRRIFTAHTQFVRKKAKEELDFDFEGAFQFGRSRASRSSADRNDLDHLAWFLHGEFGYTLDHDWKPRFALQFDYASGDRSPNDNENNRFDTLFGARRFDFGPTSIYGAFARSNVISPGLRIQIKPHEQVSLMLADRFYWLAEDRDTWTTSGVRDASGASGSFLGNQYDFRVRWDPAPKQVRVEAGVAYLLAGRFLETAPNANGEEDAAYGYIQTTFSF